MTTFILRAIDSNGDETQVAFKIPEMESLDKAFAKFDDFMSAVAGYDMRAPQFIVNPEPLDFPALHPNDAFGF
jgi:hypothetical protein